MRPSDRCVDLHRRGRRARYCGGARAAGERGGRPCPSRLASRRWSLLLGAVKRVGTLGALLACAAALMAATGADAPAPRAGGPQEVDGRRGGVQPADAAAARRAAGQARRARLRHGHRARGSHRHRVPLRKPHAAPPAHPRSLPDALRAAQRDGHQARGDHRPARRRLLRDAVTSPRAATSIALDSRPSDAIALAIRAKAPVLVEERVFEKSERIDARADRRPRGPRI